MKCVVTGGAGFIGSCLIWKLNSAGIDDIIVVDSSNKHKKSKNLEGKKFKDFFDKDEFLGCLGSGRLKEDIDTILHIGACSSTTETDREFLYKNNFLYSRELAKWALKFNKRFLYASSAATYGAGELGYSDSDELIPKLKPLNEYGRSKQLFDLWVLENNLQDKFVGFKFFNVFGPNEYHKGDMRSMVNKGYCQIRETGRMRLFKSHRPDYKDGEQLRDFIYVKDAIDIVYYFVSHPNKNGIFNIGTGNSKTWNDLANALFLAMGKRANIEYFDMPAQIKEQYQYYTEADLTKLRAAGCGHKFVSLGDAVKDYTGYLESGGYL